MEGVVSPVVGKRTLAAAPLLAGVRLVPRVRPFQRSHPTPQGLRVLAELACGKFSIRFSGPPLGSHYGNPRRRRPAVLVSHVFPRSATHVRRHRIDCHITSIDASTLVSAP